jgi:hypothetical protein
VTVFAGGSVENKLRLFQLFYSSGLQVLVLLSHGVRQDNMVLFETPWRDIEVTVCKGWVIMGK